MPVAITVAILVSTSTSQAYPQLSILHPKGGISRVFSYFPRSTSSRSKNNLVQSPIRYFKAPSFNRSSYKKIKNTATSWMSPIHFLDVPYVSNARPVRPYRLNSVSKPSKQHPKPVFSPFNAISSIINRITKSNIFHFPTRFVNNGRPYSVYKLHKRSSRGY